MSCEIPSHARIRRWLRVISASRPGEALAQTSLERRVLLQKRVELAPAVAETAEPARLLEERAMMHRDEERGVPAL